MYQKRHLLKDSPFEIVLTVSVSEEDSSAFPGHTTPIELQRAPNTLPCLSLPYTTSFQHENNLKA